MPPIVSTYSRAADCPDPSTWAQSGVAAPYGIVAVVPAPAADSAAVETIREPALTW
jgi:hypothetical protein